MRTTTLALAILASLALASCRIKQDPTFDATSAACVGVGQACGDHPDCCSYACVMGVCIANQTAGGACRNSDDCNYTMTCVSGRCQTGYTCQPTVGDRCASNNDCCSGNCLGENASAYPPVSGTCADEHPPVVALGGPYTVPYFATTVLHATASDPDPEDVLYYAWDVLSAPTGVTANVVPPTGTGAAGASPSIFLSAKGTYSIRVRVADGPASQRGRVTVTDTMTIVAVNLPPVVDPDPTHLATTALRHTSIQLDGAVSDPNGTATQVSCAWYAKPPGLPEIATPIVSYPLCLPTFSTNYQTSIDGPEGVWEFRLEAFDGELTTSAVRRINVVNQAPVAQACAYECASPPAGAAGGIRVGNLGPAGQAAPSIPLHGSAVDANGDVGQTKFTWQWLLDSVPAGSALTPGLVLGSSADAGVHTPPFDGALDPDVAGTYVVRLHVDDGWPNGTANSTVPVRVDPYLRPLFPIDGGTGLPFGGDVPDASYAHPTDRIAFVGTEESSGTPRAWLLDPEGSPTLAIPYANLAQPASSLAVDPTGTSGIVGEVGSFERLSLTTTPSASNSTYLGFTPNVVLDTGNREYALAPNGQVYDISASGTFSVATCSAGSTCVGTRGAAADSLLWLVDDAGYLRRYSVPPSSKLTQTATVSGLSGATNVWASALYGGGTARDIVVSTGARYSDSAVSTTLNPAVPALPFAVRHVDTTAVGTDISGAAVSAAGDEVRTIGAGWVAPPASALALPSVGYLGTGYPTAAWYAFVRTDGSRTYVVLRVLVAGKYRWYLARY
jgi:hypothetical protein